MGQRMRLDKVLAHMGFGTRNEVKKIVKQGAITINGETVRDSGLVVDPESAAIKVKGQTISYRPYVYIMLNKPDGVISATEDSRQQTVLDLLEGNYQGYALFPVGRLDRDTEGLLLLTNDGELAHRLLSPRKHIPKTYYAEVDGSVDSADIAAFKEGIILDDGYHTLPAELTILESGQQSRIELTIYEGKFHQVKRMFASVGKQVLYLKRMAMGSLQLDPALPNGAYRELTDAEVAKLNEHTKEDKSKNV